MKVLGISGTPRKGGNSEVLLDAALTPFQEDGWETMKILLSQVHINPCIGCETCINSGLCAIQDDMAKVYEAYAACDALIISSPVYWRDVTAQLKAVMDRTFAAFYQGSLRGKPGGAIAVGRSSGGGGQTLVLNTIHNFYLSSGMYCVPGELNGVSASADKPGEIAHQPKRLAQAAILGKNILDFCKKQPPERGL